MCKSKSEAYVKWGEKQWEAELIWKPNQEKFDVS